MPDPGALTERQQKWFASVHDGLERDTGKSLVEWAELARACPETAHRKRLAWMKAQFGLGQNRASMVLNAAFPQEAAWSQPDALADALWTDPAAIAIFQAVRQAALTLPDVVVGQRKAFTAFSRKLQFAAVKPVKQRVLLGLAVAPDGHPELQPASRESWSERLLSRMVLPDAGAVTPRVLAHLRASWEKS